MILDEQVKLTTAQVSQANAQTGQINSRLPKELLALDAQVAQTKAQTSAITANVNPDLEPKKPKKQLTLNQAQHEVAKSALTTKTNIRTRCSSGFKSCSSRSTTSPKRTDTL